MAVNDRDLCIQRHFYTSTLPWKREWSKAAVLLVVLSGSEAGWSCTIPSHRAVLPDHWDGLETELQVQLLKLLTASLMLKLQKCYFSSLWCFVLTDEQWLVVSRCLEWRKKTFRRNTSDISGKMWCTHLGFGNEDMQHKDAAEHRRWLHQGTCSSHCSSPLLSVARKNRVWITLTAVTGWSGTWYLLFRRCQHPVSDHGHVGIAYTSFFVGDYDTYFLHCLFTCGNSWLMGSS